MRGERPFVMTNLKKSEGLERIIGPSRRRGVLRRRGPRQAEAIRERRWPLTLSLTLLVLGIQTCQFRALRDAGAPESRTTVAGYGFRPAPSKSAVRLKYIADRNHPASRNDGLLDAAERQNFPNFPGTKSPRGDQHPPALASTALPAAFSLRLNLLRQTRVRPDHRSFNIRVWSGFDFASVCCLLPSVVASADESRCFRCSPAPHSAG